MRSAYFEGVVAHSPFCECGGLLDELLVHEAQVKQDRVVKFSDQLASNVPKVGLK